MKQPVVVASDWALAAVADLPPLVAWGQVATLLGVSRRTLARWRASGKLRAIRTAPTGSGRVLVAREDVARLLTALK